MSWGGVAGNSWDGDEGVVVVGGGGINKGNMY